MDRRKFLRGLLALPFVPLAAKLAPESATQWLLNWPDRHPPKGSDQISITLLDWAKAQNQPLLPVVEALSQRNNLLQDIVWKGPAPIGHKILMGSPPNWLKRSINGY